MNMDSLRADGWADVVVLFLTTIVLVCIWYLQGLYLNWIVFSGGIGAGVVWYFIIEFAEENRVSGFLLTMTYIFVMVLAMQQDSLVAGVVALWTTTTAIKVYDVYL